MTAVLGFTLECAAIAALLGTAASLLVLLAAAALRAFAHRAGPSLRADLAFLGGVLPAIVAVAGTAAVALPSLASALGAGPDHCLQHEHHLHVCIIHASTLRPELAALGALAIALWTMRAAWLLAKLRQASRDAAGLERLGTTLPARFSLIQVPGAARLCHAVGALRPRVLISDGLAQQLDPGELRCVLAHESAHLERRDPLANLILALAGSFAPPFCAGALGRAYRGAAEQACDDAAAHAVSDPGLVAHALVTVARLQRDAARVPAGLAAFGFGQHPLEIRVRRLLAATPCAPRRARALPLAAGLAAAVLALAARLAPSVHHAVETALHVVF